MTFRLIGHRTTNRWLEAEQPFDGDLDGFGVVLPEGAKVHSIVPVKTHTEHSIELGASTEAVAEWMIFIAVPLEEGP